MVITKNDDYERHENIFALAALTLVSGAAAQNPVVQTWFTTDPAPLVHNDTLYLYTGHDEDKADFSGCRNGGFIPLQIW